MEKHEDSRSPMLSVITPFYNTDLRFFTACVSSVLNQEYKDFEWIIVDDGSEKKYADYLDDLGMRDGRIRIIHQDNGGCSAARNTALDEARGRYYTFVDSDDTVEPIFFSHAIDELENTGVDIVYGYLVREQLDGTIDRSKIDKIPWKKRHFAGDDFKMAVRSAIAGEIIKGSGIEKLDAYTVAPRVYRRSVLGDVRFAHECKYSEDSLYNFMTLQKVSSLTVVNECWYIYMNNSSSIVKDVDEQKQRQNLVDMSYYYNYLIEHGAYKSDVALKVFHMFVTIIRVLSRQMSVMRLRDFLLDISKEDFYFWFSHIDAKQYEVSSQFSYLLRSCQSGQFWCVAILLKVHPYIKRAKNIVKALKQK
ncbi:MAG: glycosyltransferase [Actinomycetaceae bacterium]|nr:glycosyltransferase [Actinomycetaceae bacterium]